MENNINNLRKSLMERAKEFSARLPFMDGKDKGNPDELLGQVSTINDYGFLPSEDGSSYVVFTVAERSGKFYFGGSVLTERMSQLDQEGYGEAIREGGLPVLMTQAKARKSGRTYTNVEFFPG